MRITDYMTEADILPDLQASTREGVLQEMVRHLSDEGKISDPSGLVQILLEREALGSTGIGYGVAIPHGRLPGLKEILLVFGRSGEGIEFDAQDGKPVKLFFLLIAPEDSAGLHLKALARISRILKNPECRSSLMNARDREGIYKVIRGEDEKQ
jgi:PTS system nitrogen regulatory IIA component